MSCVWSVSVWVISATEPGGRDGGVAGVHACDQDCVFDVAAVANELLPGTEKAGRDAEHVVTL